MLICGASEARNVINKCIQYQCPVLSSFVRLVVYYKMTEILWVIKRPGIDQVEFVRDIILLESPEVPIFLVRFLRENLCHAINCYSEGCPYTLNLFRSLSLHKNLIIISISSFRVKSYKDHCFTFVKYHFILIWVILYYAGGSFHRGLHCFGNPQGIPFSGG